MLVDAVERGLYWLSSFGVEGDVESHSRIRSVLSTTTLQTVTDDLMSIIEIKGAGKLMGDSEFETMAGRLGLVLGSIMGRGNGRRHSFAIGSRVDPSAARRVLEDIYRPSMGTAQRLGATSNLLIEDQLETLSHVCTDETSYLVVYTHRAGLTKAELLRVDEWREDLAQSLSKAGVKLSFDEAVCQPIRPGVPQVVNMHESCVKTLLSVLCQDINRGGVDLIASVMRADDGLALIRRHHDASGFPASWRPRLLGSKSASRPSLVAERDGDLSHLMPMRIGRQMVSEPYQEIFGDFEIARRGQLYYGGVALEVPPTEGSRPFAELARTIGRRIPMSVNVEVVPNGQNLRMLDKSYAAVVGAMGDYNKAVRAGWRAIQDMRKRDIYIAGVRMVFVTWGKSEREVYDNVAFMRSAIESWGSAVVTNETASPALMALCAAAGFSRRMPAQFIPAPIAQAARMLPVFRPASLWNAGHLVARTADGRPYPIMLGSELQAFWGTAIFAPTGMGKSFLMNMLNWGLLFSPGLDELPYLTNIDVGSSGKLTVDLAKAVLPKRLADQVQYVRIRNEPRYALNPFDTQLGLDEQTPKEREASVSVVATMCPGLGPEGERFIGQVIDEAYKMFGRKSSRQRRWQGTMDARVSDALKVIGYTCNDDTFVWEVVDALFAAGKVFEAAVAQRHAVPRVPELIKACNVVEVTNNWGTATTPSGEPMLSVFARAIATAQKDFALLCGVTQFDLGTARVVSIDLEEVVSKSETEEGRRRAAMMYLFGRRLGAASYFLRWEEIERLVPEGYLAYHRKRITSLETSLKFLQYDELHFASGMPAMMAQVCEDLRVGRKYKCVTMMCSQLLQDFPAAAVSNAYNIFILGVGTQQDVAAVQSTFGLSESEIGEIEAHCTGPGRLFGMFKTKERRVSQVLYTPAGPVARWAFGSDQDDRTMRNKVVESMGGDYLGAIKQLARALPSGSCMAELSRMRRAKTAYDAESVYDKLLDRIMAGEEIEADNG